MSPIFYIFTPRNRFKSRKNFRKKRESYERLVDVTSTCSLYEWLWQVSVDILYLCSSFVSRDKHNALVRDITSLLLFMNNEDDDTTLVRWVSLSIDPASLDGLFSLQWHSGYRYIRSVTRVMLGWNISR